MDSRPAQANTIRRRRLCLVCGYRFTTYERITPTIKKIKRYSIDVGFPMPRSKRGRWIELLLDLADMKKTIPEEDPSFLVLPEDYGGNVNTVRSNIYHSAKSRGLKIKTNITNKGLRIWLADE